jgi:branched-chain amino acid transport system permease protein
VNAQQLFNILSIACLYGLFAVGLNLIMGVARVLNLAQPAVFTWGALAAWLVISDLHAPAWLGFVAALAAGVVLGAALELAAFRPLRRRKADELTVAIASIGLLTILVGAARSATGASFLTFARGALPEGGVVLPGVIATPAQLAIIGVTLGLVLLLSLYLKLSANGIAIRAAVYSDEVAAINGVNVDRVYLATVIVGSALGALSGLLLGWSFNNVHYQMGEPFILRGIAIIFLGGFGSVPGALLGALVLAASEVLSVVYIGNGIRELVPFAMIVAVLLLRPQGLLPISHEDRA